MVSTRLCGCSYVNISPGVFETETDVVGSGSRKTAGSMEVLRPVILLLMVHTCLLFLGHKRAGGGDCLGH